jgi:glutamate-1-semialdehyde 2,1-aminomutase
VPVAAYGARAELMNNVSPLGPVYQAGTLAGNPLAMSAGVATLKQLAAPGFYEAIEKRARRLADGLRDAAEKAGVAAQVNAVGSLATMFFAPKLVRNYSDAKTSDTKRYGEFFRNMRAYGRGHRAHPGSGT